MQNRSQATASYDLVGIPPVPDWLVEGDVPHRKVPFSIMTPVEYSPSPVGRLLQWPGLACALRAIAYNPYRIRTPYQASAFAAEIRSTSPMSPGGFTEPANICQVALHQAPSEQPRDHSDGASWLRTS